MDNSSSEGGKCTTNEKKTRRRLRLSCVECTKRRQKCDRKHPCSLCVTRGVAHLCRWESVPVARPAPARPPTGALREASAIADDQSQLVTDLKRRIAALENELEKSRQQPSSPHLSLTSGSRALSTPPSSNATDVSANGNFSPLLSDISHRLSPAEQFHEYTLLSTRPSPEIAPLAPLDDEAYEATSSMAYLSLAHHGEFVGRGSLICALHSMTSRKVPRFLYAKSTDAMSEYREPAQRFSSISFGGGSIDELVPYLPTMLVVETLTSAFFAEANWRYGIPEDWFRGARSQMWMNLQHRHSGGSQINTNWLILLFAVLASAPQSAYDEVQHFSATRSSDDYFMCAMMARRMVEDEYLNVPSASLMVTAADGTVLGCLATPLLCDYLAERGRISEAWKLVGHGIRNAEAVGMHRDPEWKLWQMMSADEKMLRRRAWWGLFISDKTYSYVLGRPQVLRREIYDVELPPAHNQDGSRNLINFGQNVLVSLMELLSDAIEMCFNVDFPDCSAFFETDRKFEEWEERLPVEYQLGCESRLLQEFSPAELKILARQRYLIHTWHMIGRLKLHITSTTGLGRAPQSPLDIRQSLEKCISISIQIIRFQSAVYGSLSRPCDNFAHVYPGSCWLFEGCFSLFEASVALITTMAQLRLREKVADANSAIDSALLIFDEVARREEGKTRETATRAIEVLITIRNQQWLEDENSFHLPKIKDDPEILDLSIIVNINKTIGDTSSMANVFASGPQFSLHCMPTRENDNAQLHKFSRIDDIVNGYNRENVRMVDHMDSTRVGLESTTRLGRL